MFLIRWFRFSGERKITGADGRKANAFKKCGKQIRRNDRMDAKTRQMAESFHCPYTVFEAGRESGKLERAYM